MLDVISTLISDAKTTLKFDDIIISEKKNSNVIVFFMDIAFSHLPTSIFIYYHFYHLTVRI